MNATLRAQRYRRQFLDSLTRDKRELDFCAIVASSNTASIIENPARCTPSVLRQTENMRIGAEQDCEDRSASSGRGQTVPALESISRPCV